eukprot:PhM_4_TR4138/c0_g1_i1/m.69937
MPRLYVYGAVGGVSALLGYAAYSQLYLPAMALQNRKRSFEGDVFGEQELYQRLEVMRRTGTPKNELHRAHALSAVYALRMEVLANLNRDLRAAVKRDLLEQLDIIEKNAHSAVVRRIAGTDSWWAVFARNLLGVVVSTFVTSVLPYHWVRSMTLWCLEVLSGRAPSNELYRSVENEEWEGIESDALVLRDVYVQPSEVEVMTRAVLIARSDAPLRFARAPSPDYPSVFTPATLFKEHTYKGVAEVISSSSHDTKTWVCVTGSAKDCGRSATIVVPWDPRRLLESITGRNVSAPVHKESQQFVDVVANKI